MSIENLGEWVTGVIIDFIAGPENSMGKWNNEPAWAEPLVGFSNGADPLYDFYKEDIGNFYILPDAYMSDAHGKEYRRENLTVVS